MGLKQLAPEKGSSCIFDASSTWGEVKRPTEASQSALAISPPPQPHPNTAAQQQTRDPATGGLMPPGPSEDLLFPWETVPRALCPSSATSTEVHGLQFHHRAFLCWGPPLTVLPGLRSLPPHSSWQALSWPQTKPCLCSSCLKPNPDSGDGSVGKSNDHQA